MNRASVAVVVLLVAGAAGGVFYWWRTRQVPPPAPPPPRVATVPAAEVRPAAPPPAPTPPAVRHPVDRGAAAEKDLPALDQADAYIKDALGGLLGRKGGLLSFLSFDGIARRFVVTVDNLATDHAPADMWPVTRTAGRFEAEERAGAGGRAIAARNADRYATFVRLAAEVDSQRAVALYVRLYPLFQQAYEDLGYPGKYFNDRVIEVIDHLLATPDPSGPVKVKLIEVDAAARGTRSGGGGALYLFEDPALEASSAGRKILLRMGRDNAAKVKAKLADVRQRIAKGPGTGAPR